MTVLQCQVAYNLEISDAKKWAEESARRQLYDGIGDMVFENTDQVICLFPKKIVERVDNWRLDGSQMVVEVSVECVYANSYPIIVPEWKYREVVSPSKLSFFQRVRFILTGKYPGWE